MTRIVAATPAEYEGWKLYHSYCDRCHAQDAMGSTFAPDLRRSISPEGLLTRDDFITVAPRRGCPASAPS